MATPESKVKAKVTDLLKKYGAYYYYIAQNGYGVSGGFDIVGCIQGYFFGVEVKADGSKRPTVLQSRNAAKALAAHAVILLIHEGNLDVLENFLKGASNESLSRPVWQSVWPFDSVV